jgi:branched-chain amino acid transport system ATP-binding protein
MTDEKNLLTVQRVEATYSRAIVALHDVNLTVRPGEIVALLGANGAGKTTTLRAISNLLPAERGQVTHGTIVFDGIATPSTRPGDLVRRGLVPVLEGRRVFRSLTVEENLITGGIARDATRAELSADLARVYALFPRLRDKRRVLAGLTSGGEQQMAAIGRALMARPRLLLLDEPSMGLAPLLVRIIFQALARLNRDDGLSILVSEQNAAVALRHAHRAVVLENGVSVLAGGADELRRRDDIRSFYLGEAAPHAA